MQRIFKSLLLALILLPVSVNAMTIKDVNEKNTYYPYIEECINKGYMVLDDNKFYPNKEVTKVLANAVINSSFVTLEERAKIDKSQGQLISVAYGNRLITMTELNHRDNNIKTTRNNIARNMEKSIRAYNYGTKQASKFKEELESKIKDSDEISKEGIECNAVYTNLGVGIYWLDENGYLNPSKPLTRAEVARITINFREAINKAIAEKTSK